MGTGAYTPEEPIAAIATALSPAALGIVRVSGTACIERLCAVFSRPNALRQAAGNSIVYGWLCNAGCRIDEVLVSVFRAPKSFTGEDMAEISCHGGIAVVNAVYRLLLQNGFRAAQKGEFTFRAYINGKADLTKAEAVKEIIDSRTGIAAERAAGRLSGALYARIDRIKRHIIDTLAAIEVEIEYPEDEQSIADSFEQGDLRRAADELRQLAQSWAVEKVYQDGARVVLCGRTNAGKSSLFNALLKEERAIVSDIEGTTRDWIESWVSFNGIPARLFDTAGLRASDDLVERQGVERSRDLAREADIILYIADRSCALHEDDRDFLQQERNGTPLVFVWNKCDMPLGQAQMPCGEPDAICAVSARTGAGIEALCGAVHDILCLGSDTGREQAGLGSARQKAAVQDALGCVCHALQSAEDNYSLDAVVQDLEDALDALGTVTGDVTPDDVLDSIFSHFCVGK